MPLDPARSGQLVYVDWLDAHAGSTWCGKDEIEHRGETVRSYGVVVRHDEKGIMLAADVEQGDDPLANDVNRTLFIPGGMVESVWEIHF